MAKTFKAKKDFKVQPNGSVIEIGKGQVITEEWYEKNFATDREIKQWIAAGMVDGSIKEQKKEVIKNEKDS